LGDEPGVTFHEKREHLREGGEGGDIARAFQSNQLKSFPGRMKKETAQFIISILRKERGQGG